MKSKARHIEHLNEPTAIIEMKLKNEAEEVSQRSDNECLLTSFSTFN